MKKYRVFGLNGYEYVIAQNREEAFETLKDLYPYAAIEVPLNAKEVRIRFLGCKCEAHTIEASADYGDFAIEYVCDMGENFIDERIELTKDGENVYSRVKLYLLCEHTDYVRRFDDTEVFVYLIKHGYNPYDVMEELVERIALKANS